MPRHTLGYKGYKPVNKNERRLAETIQPALQLAIEQGDATIARLLHDALELALTRRSGGLEFVERRYLVPEISATIDAYYAFARKVPQTA